MYMLQNTRIFIFSYNNLKKYHNLAVFSSTKIHRSFFFFFWMRKNEGQINSLTIALAKRGGGGKCWNVRSGRKVWVHRQRFWRLENKPPNVPPGKEQQSHPGRVCVCVCCVWERPVKKGRVGVSGMMQFDEPIYIYIYLCYRYIYIYVPLSRIGLCSCCLWFQNLDPARLWSRHAALQSQSKNTDTGGQHAWVNRTIRTGGFHLYGLCEIIPRGGSSP